MEYTREDLIDLLEKAIVPEGKWSDRDSDSAQSQCGEALALLKCGCDFNLDPSERLKPDSNIIWIEIHTKGFSYFEGGDKESETYYIPTQKKLDEVNGGDWY